MARSQPTGLVWLCRDPSRPRAPQGVLSPGLQLLVPGLSFPPLGVPETTGLAQVLSLFQARPQVRGQAVDHLLGSYVHL